MKDMVKIYKVYHMIVQEILERFPTLKKDQCQDAYRVYADFCEDTPKIKKVINGHTKGITSLAFKDGMMWNKFKFNPIFI